MNVTFTNTSVEASNYLWIFGDQSISNSISPSHDFINNGKDTITYKVKMVASNGSCISDTFAKIVKVFPILLSTDEMLMNNGINVFPNPIVESLNIRYHLSQSEKVTVDVFENSGRLINHVAEKLNLIGDQIITLNLGNQINGIVIVRLKIGATSYSFKRIVQR